MTGADALVASFLAHGVQRLYVYPGGTIAPIFDAALARGIELITARHEQGAGYGALAESVCRCAQQPEDDDADIAAYVLVTGALAWAPAGAG